MKGVERVSQQESDPKAPVSGSKEDAVFGAVDSMTIVEWLAVKEVVGDSWETQSRRLPSQAPLPFVVFLLAPGELEVLQLVATAAQRSLQELAQRQWEAVVENGKEPVVVGVA